MVLDKGREGERKEGKGKGEEKKIDQPAVATLNIFIIYPFFPVLVNRF
jgi:hypothetical protein